MDAINLREVKAYGMSEIFAEPPEKPREVLFTFQGVQEWENVQAKTNSFTIVLQRHIRGTMEMSSEMAVFRTKKYPAQNILLINTYAGTDLMQETLSRAMQQCKIVLPPSYRRHFKNPDDSWFSEEAAPPCPNLRLLNCPLGTCTPWRIDAELALAPASIVILNSFEFAALSSWDRSVLSEGLLATQQKYGLSVIIFSQEMRTDVSPFLKSRGPIGALSANAHAVWKVMTPWEQDSWDKKRKNWPSEWRR